MINLLKITISIHKRSTTLLFHAEQFKEKTATISQLINKDFTQNLKDTITSKRRGFRIQGNSVFYRLKVLPESL